MIIKMNRKQFADKWHLPLSANEFRYLFGEGRHLGEKGIKFLKVNHGKDKGVSIIPFLFSSPDKI